MVIAVPVSNPYKVFLIASVPLKLSPELVPPTVFPCASEVTPPDIPVRDEPSPTKLVAVKTPATLTLSKFV